MSSFEDAYYNEYTHPTGNGTTYGNMAANVRKPSQWLDSLRLPDRAAQATGFSGLSWNPVSWAQYAPVIASYLPSAAVSTFTDPAAEILQTSDDTNARNARGDHSHDLQNLGYQAAQVGNLIVQGALMRGIPGVGAGFKAAGAALKAGDGAGAVVRPLATSTAKGVATIGVPKVSNDLANGLKPAATPAPPPVPGSAAPVAPPKMNVGGYAQQVMDTGKAYDQSGTANTGKGVSRVMINGVAFDEWTDPATGRTVQVPAGATKGQQVTVTDQAPAAPTPPSGLAAASAQGMAQYRMAQRDANAQYEAMMANARAARAKARAQYEDTVMGLNQQEQGGGQDLASALAYLGLDTSIAPMNVGLDQLAANRQAGTADAAAAQADTLGQIRSQATDARLRRRAALTDAAAGLRDDRYQQTQQMWNRYFGGLANA